MKFADSFVAKTGMGSPTVILWADKSPSERVRFSIGASMLTEQLGVGNPVSDQSVIKSCEAQRDKIEAACLRAFHRDPSIPVTLTDADFEDAAQVSPPQPPSDVAGG
jgi:hypothetical protein